MERVQVDSQLDPRIQRTRRLIVQAMIDLLDQKNLSAITVQEIADRATINRATFYSHYEDKFALFTSMLQEMFAHTLEEYLSPQAPYSRQNLRLLILAVCKLLSEMNSHCSPADQEFRPMFETEIQGQIQERLEHWLPPIEGAPVLPARVAAWGIFGAVNDWSRRADREPAEELADHLVELLDVGVVAPQAGR